MRVNGIQPQDLVKLRIKERVLYGEVLDVADGIVRFRPVCPAAGWHRATARQVVGHGRKTGRRTSSKTMSQRQRASPSPQQLALPKADN